MRHARKNGLERDVVSHKTRRAAAHIGASMMQDAFFSAVTVWSRAPGLFALAPTAQDLAERQRMVSEKVAAAAEGVVAASAAAAGLWMKAATGQMMHPDDLAAGLLAVGRKAVAPARKRVKANAKRLSKG